MKIRNLIYQISFTSILSALVFIATVFISIPYAGGAGYFNLSDALILFSCAYFGPTVGLLSGIIGCSLGDLFLGYASCIPFTIFAKGIEAVAFIFLFYFVKNTKFLKLFAFIIAPLFMVLGYIPYYLIYPKYLILFTSHILSFITSFLSNTSPPLLLTISLK